MNHEANAVAGTQGVQIGRFAQVAHALSDEYGVWRGSTGKRFGHWSLQVDDQVFAKLSPGGQFVVALPHERVDALVSASAGRRFSSEKGHPTKGWLAVHTDAVEDWIALAREAMRYVRRLE